MPPISATCQPIPLDKIRVPATARTFALEVKGDGLEGLHLRAGDIVVCEHGAVPRPGDLVAALVDDENVLGVLVSEGKRVSLRTGPDRKPVLLPADDLVFQGVVVAVVRRMAGPRPGATAEPSKRPGAGLK